MSKRAELQRAVRLREVIVQAMTGLTGMQAQFTSLLEDCDKRILELTLEVHSDDSTVS